MGTGGYQIDHKSATQLANELYEIRLDIVIDGVSMTGLDIVKIANKVMKIESIYAKAEQEGAAGSMLA